MPSRPELLEVIAEVEDFERTLARFPGLSKDQLIGILRTGRAVPSSVAAVVEPPPERVRGPATPRLAIWTDGASRGNPGPASVGVMIENARGELVDELAERIGVRTNNYAEYEAVRRGLRRALELGADRVVVHADSELVVRQLTGMYRVKHADLLPLYQAVKATEASFARGVEYQHVPREKNVDADRLANVALDTPASGD